MLNCSTCHRRKPVEHFYERPGHIPWLPIGASAEDADALARLVADGIVKNTPGRGAPPASLDNLARARERVASGARQQNAPRERGNGAMRDTRDLSALRGIRIHAGHAVDTSRLTSSPSASTSAPDTPPASSPPDAPASDTATAQAVQMPRPRENTISCRQWLQSATARPRLFLCANGRYVIEQVTGEPGHTAQFLIWHLNSEHRHVEQAPTDARTIITLLSFIAPDVLDKPGTIYGA